MNLLLKNALVYQGDSFAISNIFIRNSKIHNQGISISPNGDVKTFDCKNKYLLIPGFVDVHVHLREPGFSYKETIKTGTMAAAKAGYTAVCSMPNLNPAPDCIENLNVQKEIINNDAVIDVFPFATITRGRKGEGTLVDFGSLKNEVIGFSDDGCGVQTDELMEQAFKECAKNDCIISAHCEVNELLNGGYIHDGEYCKNHNHKGICSKSEWQMIKRDCELAKKYNCKYHVCHISTKESVEIIRQAKKDGVRVTCETGPHYLTMNDNDLHEDGRFKMNPPIRSEEDRLALIDGIKDGTIDVIATDHAPHSAEEKSKGLKDSAMGITGLETAFSVLYTKLVKENIISLQKLIELMCINPRKIFGIEGGTIADGEVADLCLIDLDKEFIVNPENFVSKGKSTPFKDWKLQGENLLTILRGEIVYETI